MQKIVKQAIDVHVHIGPEVIPRKYTTQSLAESETGKIAGAVLKNHFYVTTPFVQAVKNLKSVRLFGSVVLNSSVGGLNPAAIYATSAVAENPIVVWFPTIHAENFLRQSTFEIAPEWVKKKGFVARKAKNVKPVIVTKNGRITKEALIVLKAIQHCKAVLATGHISWQESLLVVKEAMQIGIRRIIITHPIYQRIAMPIQVQKELAEKGCFIEQSYSMYAIDKIPIANIVQQIKAVGPKSVIVSSDVGQVFSPSPSEALAHFATLLMKEGIGEKNIVTMMIVNPRKLLGLRKV